MNRSMLFKYGLSVLTLAGVAVAGVKYLSGEEVLAALHSFRYMYLPLMLLLSTLYLLLQGMRFVLLARPVTDLPWHVILRAFLAGCPATLIPGGVAVRAALMNEAGVPLDVGAWPVVLASLMDQSFFVVGALLAAFWYPVARLPTALLVGVLALVGALCAVPQIRQQGGRLAGWVAGKFHVEESWHRFLKASQEILTVGRLSAAFGITMLSYALLLVVLHLSFQGLDKDLPYPALFLSLVLPTILARLAPVPGGFGVTEAGIVGFLIATTAVGRNTAAVAVALYRITTILWQTLLGALVYFLAWQGKGKRGRMPLPR